MSNETLTIRRSVTALRVQVPIFTFLKGRRNKPKIDNCFPCKLRKCSGRN